MFGLWAEDGCVVVSHLNISVVVLEMSSVQGFRDFINERLTAAAVEIFSVFERTIVQYEKEIDRQRRLLDISWKPQINSHRAELPEQYVCKEEGQQLCNQERNSNPDQEEPEPLHIKEEQEELCTTKEGDHFALKQETDAFMVTLTYEESDHSEPEPDSEQLFHHNSPAVENQDQRGHKVVVSRSTTNAKRRPISPLLESQCDTDTGEKTVKCDICGKAFKYKYQMKRHYRIHTGEKAVKCDVCGKAFTKKSQIKIHHRIHTGEKPYACETCGKRFRSNDNLLVHLRSHTGERPYPCNTCGKRFTCTSHLKSHMRIHTGEKPYPCNTCGKRFIQTSNLKVHMRTHSGEKPYSCKLCDKSFRQSGNLLYHIRMHTEEKS